MSVSTVFTSTITQVLTEARVQDFRLRAVAPKDAPVSREFSPFGQKWLFNIMDPPPYSKAVTIEPRQRFSLG